MENAGSNINLTISSCSLALTILETGQIIAKHEMPRISFASGGDTVRKIINILSFLSNNLILNKVLFLLGNFRFCCLCC